MLKFMLKRSRDLIILLFLFLSCFVNMQAQYTSKAILNKEIKSDFYAENILHVCGNISLLADIPCGLEAASGFNIAQKDSRVLVKKAKLREVLSEINKHYPDYRWEINEGVINIIPIKNRDAVTKAFLETKFNINVSKEIYSFKEGALEFGNKIYESDEAKKFLKYQKSKFNTFVFNKSDNSEKFVIKLNDSASSLRSLLNNIVKNSSRKVWLINQVGNENESDIVIVF